VSKLSAAVADRLESYGDDGGGTGVGVGGVCGDEEGYDRDVGGSSVFGGNGGSGGGGGAGGVGVGGGSGGIGVGAAVIANVAAALLTMLHECVRRGSRVNDATTASEVYKVRKVFNVYVILCSFRFVAVLLAYAARVCSPWQLHQ
jgi:hypothetical protein